jgi:GDPmannose 4,6-dehydratase
MTGRRRALITGVSGQDGWYLSRMLLEEGYQVFGLIRPGDPLEPPRSVELVSGDLADRTSVAEAVAVAAPDEIYNLGGVSSVGLSWQEPLLTAQVTGLGLLNVIEGVRAASYPGADGVRIVQASSAEIFGDAPAPQNEQTAIRPITPYGAAKAFAHHTAAVFRAAGLSVSTAILFNHESPRRPETFVTRRISRQVAEISLGLRDTLVIGNLDARRDWGYAGDYADALRRIGRHEVAGDFVIATGISRSVGDFAEAAFAHVGITDWRPLVSLDPDFVRPTDAVEHRGDAGRAHRELGWVPRTGFADLVAAMVDADLSALRRGSQRRLPDSSGR